MRKTFPILALLAAALPARATLLDFEDLGGEDYGTVVGYGPAFSTHGFDFVETGDSPRRWRRWGWARSRFCGGVGAEGSSPRGYREASLPGGV